MDTTELQLSFFKHLKEKMPSHISFVDEVAELLNISNDSAYRRIRGEKTLGLDEIQLLAKHYGVSLDQFFHIRSRSIVFDGNYINRDRFTFENYLHGIVQQLSLFTGAQQKEMFYHNKDVPIFHHFMFPELAAFKCYFWSRYNLNNSKYNKGQLLISDFIDVFNTLGKQISDLYLQIPSTEIWNLDCINTTIRQIDYYRESKIFKSDNDIITVYHCLEKLVDHIEQQVELGYKFPFGKPSEAKKVKYTVFINEFVLGDNTVIAHVDGKKLVFMNHSVINYIMTTDEGFIDYASDSMQILLKKSTLISEIGEKDRQLFFDNLRQRIYDKRKLV
ncbi:MAG TPA: helix-turn-helix transcriptional regulator [Chitinophagaceae bacterium]|nr:helix-turn-helix transcriptional regulator [Chitinophagaceae bacterium]